MTATPATPTPMTPQELAALQPRQQAAAPRWWKLSAEEVARAYAAGRRDFERADLRSADLRGANLTDADLTRANLTDANLTDADLYDADLRNADLRSADLRRANLYGADLRGADLRGADLRGADLYGANLRGADLRNANLGGANLRGADLRGADLIRVPGVYSDYSPHLSSRGAPLLGGLDLVNDAIVLRFWAGCQECKSAEELRARVKREHGDNLHAELYELAIAHIEAAFAVEMKAGMYGHLLTWNADHPAVEVTETSVAE